MESPVEFGRNGKPLKFNCFICEKQTVEEFCSIPQDIDGGLSAGVSRIRASVMKLPFTYKLCPSHCRKVTEYLNQKYPEEMKKPFNFSERVN